VNLDADGLDGGFVTLRGDTSSQFLSGLLMALPYARQGQRRVAP
jgi:3-phosphoshikimate 1-carboxyvinyltransferase